MPLGLSDLDPEIAERVKAKDLEARRFATFGAMESARRAMAKDEETKRAFAAEVRLADAIQAEKSESESRDRIEIIKLKKQLRNCIALFCFFGVLIYLFSFLSPYSVKNYAFPLMILIGVGLFPFQILLLKYFNLKDIGSWRNEKPRSNIPTKTIAAIFPTVGHSEVEVSYGQSAASLFESVPPLGEDTARELLSTLNDLLTAARRLEGEKSALDAAMAGQSLAQIETERDGLQARIEASSDSIARETLIESLKQCEARLVRARGLAPLQERIDAQLLGIAQTMRSVQSSVASLKLAPSASADLDALRETACELAGRTRAIEDAVQEVLALRN